MWGASISQSRHVLLTSSSLSAFSLSLPLSAAGFAGAVAHLHAGALSLSLLSIRLCSLLLFSLSFVRKLRAPEWYSLALSRKAAALVTACSAP